MSGVDAQARVQVAIDRLVRSGAEVGLQVAVVRHGRVVVDAAAGWRDAGRRCPVVPDTLFYAASTAKGVASVVAHVLVERGELDYDMRAADVWPEFGAHGEQYVTLRHVLLHRAGRRQPGVADASAGHGGAHLRGNGRGHGRADQLGVRVQPLPPGGVRARRGSAFGMVGSNGSAAYADIDSGVAVVVLRNRFSPDLSAAAEVDRVVADAFPCPAVQQWPATDDRSDHG